MIGQIAAGVVVGPSVLGWVEEIPPLELLSELGAIVLLFMVGLETKPQDILKVGGEALAVAVAGVALPLVVGVALMLWLGFPLSEGLFIGAALVATSVGITSQVLVDLGVLTRDFSRVILGAAVIDDVLGMVVLAVVSGLQGEFALNDILLVVVEAVVFVAFFVFLAPRLFDRALHGRLGDLFRAETMQSALVLVLGVAVLAQWIGLAAIIGAFLAGVLMSEHAENLGLLAGTRPLYAFLTPLFFAYIGVRVNVAQFAETPVLLLALIVTLVAIATKWIGAGAAALPMGWRKAVLIGAGMVPRGEVGFIVAGLGLSLGAIDDTLYGVVVLMAIITTLITPPILPPLIRLSEVSTGARAEMD